MLLYITLVQVGLQKMEALNSLTRLAILSTFCLPASPPILDVQVLFYQLLPLIASKPNLTFTQTSLFCSKALWLSLKQTPHSESTYTLFQCSPYITLKQFPWESVLGKTVRA